MKNNPCLTDELKQDFKQDVKHSLHILLCEFVNTLLEWYLWGR